MRTGRLVSPEAGRSSCRQVRFGWQIVSRCGRARTNGLRILYDSHQGKGWISSGVRVLVLSIPAVLGTVVEPTPRLGDGQHQCPDAVRIGVPAANRTPSEKNRRVP